MMMRRLHAVFNFFDIQTVHVDLTTFQLVIQAQLDSSYILILKLFIIIFVWDLDVMLSSFILTNAFYNSTRYLRS